MDDDPVQFAPWLEAPVVDDGTLSGTVTDVDTGGPLADVTVEALDGHTVVNATETDADGTYELTLAVGIYDVAASAENYEEVVEEDVAINDDERTTRDLALTPFQEGSIDGTVVDVKTDDPLTDAEIEIVEQQGVGEPPAVDGFTTTVQTTADGEFTAAVPPGVYQYTTSASRYEENFEQDIVVDSGEAFDVGTVELTAVSLVTGTVTRESTGEPVSGVVVEAFDGDTRADVDGTGTDGVYELQVEPGTYTITAMEEGGPGLPESGTAEDVELPAGSHVTVDIELTPSDHDAPAPLDEFDPPRDHSGDGLFEDVTGTGKLTVADVQALFDNMNEVPDEDAKYFSFSGLDDNQVTIFDVQALFNRLEE